MKIGYIGIGIMGRPMVGNLLKAGHSLCVHNRTAAKCDSLAARGATVCASPAETARIRETSQNRYIDSLMGFK